MLVLKQECAVSYLPVEERETRLLHQALDVDEADNRALWVQPRLGEDMAKKTVDRRHRGRLWLLHAALQSISHQRREHRRGVQKRVPVNFCCKHTQTHKTHRHTSIQERANKKIAASE